MVLKSLKLPCFNKDLEHDPRFNSIEARGKHAKELVAIPDERK
jgi:hypothetical protein